MLLAGVELEAHLPVDVAIHLLIGTCQALGRKIAGEIDNRLVACAFLIGDIDIAAPAACLRISAPSVPDSNARLLSCNLQSIPGRSVTSRLLPYRQTDI